ncbi:MAG: pimeloyl-ACP methyl ester carboxylesterase, partial [Patiriisocius sp.]
VSDYHRYIGSWDIAKWKQEGSLPFVNSRTKQIFNINYQFYEVLQANEEFFDIKKVCHKLNKPVLIVHAKDDAAVGSSQAEELHAWCENSELMMLETGGHTFDTHQPYNDATLPQNMMDVCEKVLSFIR